MADESHESLVLSKLDRIEGRIDHLAEGVGKLEVLTAKQQEILKEHVRRTRNLEERVKPLESSQVRWATFAKFFAAVTALAGALAAIIRLAA